MQTFARCLFSMTILVGVTGAAVTIPGGESAANPPRDADEPRLIICFEDQPGGNADAAKRKAGEKAVEPSAIVAGNTAFAFDLYRELSRADGNVFFSPLSISTALSMTFAGARSETGEEMAKVLHLPHTPQERASKLSQQNRAVHETFGNLLRGLHAPKMGDENDADEPGYEVLLANALWGHHTETFSDDYVSLVGEYYDAPLTAVDFHKPESAAEKINDWTNENTRGLIPHLVTPSDVRGASLVLTNAIYFLGDWASEFDPDKTRERDFHLGPDQSVTVPMMRQKGHYGHVKYDDARAVVMPYAGERLSMVVLLPDEGYQTDGLMEHLTADQIKAWATAPPQEVELAMPKFKMETSSRLVRGVPVLPNLGMRRAVSAAADFSGIDGGARGAALTISEVIHEAVIEVDERGTEAAAATAVVIVRASVPQPIEVTIDRPFLFLIVDHETKSILFMGRVVDPTA